MKKTRYYVKYTTAWMLLSSSWSASTVMARSLEDAARRVRNRVTNEMRDFAIQILEVTRLYN